MFRSAIILYLCTQLAKVSGMEKENMTEQDLIGYPSIDKPWLKYYGEHFDPQDIPDMSIYQLTVKYNQTRMNSVALDIRSSANGYRKGIKITYWFDSFSEAAAQIHLFCPAV